MVRLNPGEQRRSATTRRSDLPARRAAPRRPEAAADVLRAVLDHGPVARSNIARLAGVSAASISGVSGKLIDAGLVREVPEAAGPPGFGRPHVPLDLAPDASTVLAVHVAVGHARVGAVDLRGRVRHAVDVPYDAPDPRDVVRLIAAAIADARRSVPDRAVLGLGVAVGGRVDPGQGVVVDHPALGWRDLPLAGLLADASGVPTRIDNHSRALLTAEQLFGASRERARSSVVQVFVGNVVDAGFAVGGGAHRGRRSSSGTVAHLPVDAPSAWAARCECGRTGCFAATVSDRRLLQRAADLGAPSPDARALAGRAVAGEAGAIEAFVERARIVGRAVAHLLDLFDPELLVLAEAGFLWVPEAREVLLREVRARAEAAGDPAAVVAAPSAADFLPQAAAAIVLERVYADPLGAAS